jgi:DNA-binding HxlR family transcriptional regulator
MPSNRPCRLDPILNLIGDRWTLGILHNLSAGPRRTLELHAAFTGLSTRTLAQRLKSLESNGLIVRTLFRESPPRVEYSLTDRAQELVPLLRMIGEAGSRWMPPETLDRKDPICPACEIQNGVHLSVNNSTAQGPDERSDEASLEPVPAELPADQPPPTPIRRKRIDIVLL